MSKITIEIESQYDVGDVVIFQCRHSESHSLAIGIIEGFYADQSCNNTLWYNIRTKYDFVYTYLNEGDISEYDILYKLNGEMADRCKQIILYVS